MVAVPMTMKDTEAAARAGRLMLEILDADRDMQTRYASLSRMPKRERTRVTHAVSRRREASAALLRLVAAHGGRIQVNQTAAVIISHDGLNVLRFDDAFVLAKVSTYDYWNAAADASSRIPEGMAAYHARQALSLGR